MCVLPTQHQHTQTHNDKHQTVLDFVCGVVAQTAASEEEAAAELELVSDFPRRTYADTSMTLREAGLCPVAKLIVQPAIMMISTREDDKEEKGHH